MFVPSRTRLLPFVPCLFCWGLLALGTLDSQARAANPVPDLLGYIPDDANTLSVIRINDLMKSQRAQDEDWKTKADTKFLSGSVHIPPWMDVLVRGTHVQPGGAGNVLISSVATMNTEMPFEKLFPKNSGFTLDTIAGFPVVRSTHGYAGEIKSGVIGYLSPPARQDFARWMRGCKKGPSIQVSPYLREVGSRSTSPVLFAVDLEELIEPRALAARIAACQELQNKDADQAALRGLLARMRGLQVSIQVDKDIHAALTFDFNGGTIPQAVYMKPLMVELLADAGAEIAELETASVKLDSQSVTMAADLSDASLRQLMTIILSRVSAIQTEPQKESSGGPELAKTLKYFQQVTNTVIDLQRLNRSAKDYEKTAVWHENYARKIIDFSVLGVDPEVSAYGARMAQNLEALAASLRGIPVEVNLLEDKIHYQVHVSPLGYGGAKTAYGYIPAPWEVTSNVQQVRAQQAEAVARGNAQREQIWKYMEQDHLRVRNQMTAKYNVDFDKPPK